MPTPFKIRCRAMDFTLRFFDLKGLRPSGDTAVLLGVAADIAGFLSGSVCDGGSSVSSDVADIFSDRADDIADKVQKVVSIRTAARADFAALHDGNLSNDQPDQIFSGHTHCDSPLFGRASRVGAGRQSGKPALRQGGKPALSACAGGTAA